MPVKRVGDKTFHKTGGKWREVKHTKKPHKKRKV